MPKNKTYNYNFTASEVVEYDVNIEASSYDEAQEKLLTMQQNELDECVCGAEDFQWSFNDTDNPEHEEE